MATKTYTVGPGSLILGETGTPQEIAAQITSASITPSVDAEDDIPVLSGDVVPGEETYTYVLEGNLLQDISTTGINTWCRTNRGEVVPFEYVPNTVEARVVTGSIKVRDLPIGGDVKSKAVADFEFPGVGDYLLGDVAEG